MTFVEPGPPDWLVVALVVALAAAAAVGIVFAVLGAITA